MLEYTHGSLASIASWPRRMFYGNANLPCVIFGCYASGEHEAFDPIRLVQTVSSNPAVSLARVDHHAGAFVDADVRDKGSSRIARKEHEVSPLQSPAGSITDPRLTDGAPRQLDADFSIDVLGQAGAIEGAGTFSAPDVRTTDQTCCKVDGIRCRHLGSEEEKRQGYRTGDSCDHGDLLAWRTGCADRETREGKTSASVVLAVMGDPRAVMSSGCG